MRETVASAPGKVNLVLRSGAPAADGYHPLTTVFEAVSLREYVVARTRKKPGVGVRTLAYTLPATGEGEPRLNEELTRDLRALTEQEHLAAKAGRALAPLVAAKWGPSAAGLELTVHKTIPVAGGMAGGSADAAAALVAINALWELGLTGEQLEILGRTLGADVPACLRGGWSVGEERGDHLTTLADPGEKPSHWWALAFFEEGLSTPAVFARFDQMELGQVALPEASQYTDQAGSYTGPQVASLLQNDLAPAAIRLRPEIQEVGQAAIGAGAQAWMVSGSGPTVAALADTRQEAVKIAESWLENAAGGGPKLRETAVAWGADAGARVETVPPKWIQTAR